MPASAGPVRFALEVNFPQPILDALAEFMVDIELVPVQLIDTRLGDLEDRDLFLALRQEGYEWLVTNNYKILRNPMELAALMKARMKVFAIEGTGHDPLRATGAVLLDLPAALRRAAPDGVAEVFWSRPRNPEPRKPWDLFTEAAVRRHMEAADLYEEVKVTDEEAAQPWSEKVQAA